MTSLLSSLFAGLDKSLSTSGKAPSFNDFSLHAGKDHEGVCHALRAREHTDPVRCLALRSSSVFSHLALHVTTQCIAVTRSVQPGVVAWLPLRAPAVHPDVHNAGPMCDHHRLD
jgi:hypothetical protein